MKIFFVNAASSSRTEADALQKWIYKSCSDCSKLTRVDLEKKSILPCGACMSCQIKNPGICVKKDDMRELLPEYINSDVAVFMTPVFCGGYSSELKKFIDRMCPVLTACFEERNGETWHIPRYRKRPAMIGIALDDDPGIGKDHRSFEDNRSSVTIFHRLFSRNIKQLNINRYSCMVITKGMNEEELEKSFHATFNDAGFIS